MTEHMKELKEAKKAYLASVFKHSNFYKKLVLFMFIVNLLSAPETVPMQNAVIAPHRDEEEAQRIKLTTY